MVSRGFESVVVMAVLAVSSAWAQQAQPQQAPPQQAQPQQAPAQQAPAQQAPAQQAPAQQAPAQQAPPQKDAVSNWDPYFMGKSPWSSERLPPVVTTPKNVKGGTVSVTSLKAPKGAQAAFEKAGKAMQKRKWVEARRQLEKAVGIYPQYAEAWCALGGVYLQQNEPEQARKALKEAVASDPKFATPYFGLAELAMREQKWQEMAENTGALIQLNPDNLPGVYAYDALANLNLNRLDAAEKSAQEGIRIDRNGEVPKNLHLLGVILMLKGDYVGAGVHLKRYLEVARGAPGEALVKEQLAACATLAAQPRGAKR